MIGKRLIVGLLAALLVVSVIGASGVPASVLATGSSDGNDSRTTATTIDVGQTATGTIEPDDVDWYAVEIEAGQSIFANLTITTETEKSFRFDLFDPDGEKIGEHPLDMMFPGYQTMQLATGNTAYGGDVAEQSGVYYVRVQPVEDNSSEPTNYELTIEADELDMDDPNEQPNTATQIDPDATISGMLSGSDRDTYALDLEKGETITVTADYENSGFRPYTYLVGPNASNVMLDPYLDRDYAVARETIGREHEFIYTANTTGTHFLRVNPYEEISTINTFDEKTSYEVSVDVSGSTVDDDSDATDEATETPTQTPTSTPSETTLHTRTDTATHTTPTATRTNPRSQTNTASQTTPPLTQSNPTEAATTTASAERTSPEDSTATDGPGFGVLSALAAVGVGLWGSRRRA
ncbi:hypothetical protein [Halocatena marina]|uniref:hypothetical protein n=1 Tax=Halocatena marina TaxID=2934937 RepID=UPI00200D15F0|nr:hypothetical protein [Halocatena marina]